MRIYRDFGDFQHGGCRHLEFSKIQNFNDRFAVEGQLRHRAKFHQDRSNVCKDAEIWQFNGFQNGGRPPSWICEIRIS